MPVKGRKMICFAESNQKRAGVGRLTSDGTDFLTESVVRGVEGQLAMGEGPYADHASWAAEP